MKTTVREVLFVFYVADQGRSSSFYRALLGVKPSLDVPGMTEFPLTGSGRLGLMPEKGIANLLGGAIPNPALASGIPRSELYLVVDDAAKYYDCALANGAQEVSPLQQRDWGDRVAYCLDLDGHVLAFAEQHERQQ